MFIFIYFVHHLILRERRGEVPKKFENFPEIPETIDPKLTGEMGDERATGIEPPFRWSALPPRLQLAFVIRTKFITENSIHLSRRHWEWMREVFMSVWEILRLSVFGVGFFAMRRMEADPI
jgi:hypothetical protein